MAVGGVFIFSNSSMNVENDENLNEFVIIIPRLDENGNQVTKSDEKSNQVQDENGNQVTKSDEESNQVKGEKELGHPKLTKQQEDIRNFCSIPRTAQEIMDRLGITNQSKNRQRHIQPLLDMGILEMTNPESAHKSFIWEIATLINAVIYEIICNFVKIIC